MIIDLPKFLKHEAHKYMFYGWIRALRYNFPGISVEKAIENFTKHHAAHGEALNVETFNNEAARTMFYNLEKQFMELYKQSKE